MIAIIVKPFTSHLGSWEFKESNSYQVSLWKNHEKYTKHAIHKNKADLIVLTPFPSRDNIGVLIHKDEFKQSIQEGYIILKQESDL